jgi:hypothetical protein
LDHKYRSPPLIRANSPILISVPGLSEVDISAYVNILNPLPVRPSLPVRP